MYRQRNEVERLFRRVFSRFDKLDVTFNGFIHLAMVVDVLRVCEQALVNHVRIPRIVELWYRPFGHLENPILTGRMNLTN
jgi:hypothetical protein